MRLRSFLLVLPLFAVSAVTISAHHAFSPVYDAKRTITVDGVVREQNNSDGHNAQTFCLVKSA